MVFLFWAEVGSLCEGTIENEGSICGSDSTFYRQTEGNSVWNVFSIIKLLNEIILKQI